mmetsp:Transcript_2474/g.2872  ORF Transcript_2474/g.2872 Transcript_2474/m.2872 type:complete len:315 (+) Transcript_2474:85-1029(+)|eukprot:CAMPEP_0184024418 /NCGR_PEP_ID=MMETSP0954-20121128/12067_1 /TAXON_ID=627963 /ORGANISM="Aplanochytrium sp, Strain PBS07" /LENGTH=314 /DNA_ID=CAMNT_0026307735 /DNA_START=63 /DNA_END=1007 /DNA_ORIENTATION=+
MRILVCGGTGYLGGHVCKELKRRGHEVKLLSRKPKEKLAPDLIQVVDEVFVAEATKRDSLVGICDNVDAVFSSLGNHTSNRKPTIWQVDEKANLNIVEESLAKTSKVKHFVFVSVLFGDKLRKKFAQAEARERVVDRLLLECEEEPHSRFALTIIRPSGFFNDMREVLDFGKGKFVWLLGNGKNKFNPIHGEDLASFCVDKIERQDINSNPVQAFNVGGPEMMSNREVYKLASAAWHGKAKSLIFITVPICVVRAIATLIGLFNVNVESVIKMLAALSTVSTEEMETVEKYGRHTLAEFFQSEVDINNEGVHSV